MVLEQTGPLAPVHKPWQLIRDAVHDMTLQEKTPGVRVVHSVKVYSLAQYDPFITGHPCEQSPVGCVVSRRLRGPLGGDFSIEKYARNTNVSRRLHALEYFIYGNISYAYKQLRLKRPPMLRCRVYIPNYDDNPAQFKEAMLALADELEGASRITD